MTQRFASILCSRGRGCKHERLWLAAAIFLISIALRSALLLTTWDGLRHGTAAVYGSTAIGLLSGSGLTFSMDEVTALGALPGNLSGDYMRLRSAGAREALTEFLPGPAVLIAALWSCLPASAHNFAPLLIVQVLLDSIAVAALFLALSLRTKRPLAIATAVFAAVNLVSIRRTLMVGYDFWPQLGVMLLFSGTLWLFWKRSTAFLFLVLGGLFGAFLWCREITMLLPLFVAAFLLVRGKHENRWTHRESGLRALLLVVPVALSIALLSYYRMELTGSPRPTRSTFWHTFFAGVGQFPNPYGIENRDLSVWEFGQKVAPELAGASLSEMYRMPNSPYEHALRAEALSFVQQYPGIFLRNVLMRCGIMISPLLYQDGDFLPKRAEGALSVVGWVMLPLWFVGLMALRRESRDTFTLVALVYAYFFCMFGWLYVNGRVIIPYLFLAFLVYLIGAQAVLGSFVEAVNRFRSRRKGQFRGLR